jgi:hypothetical protein
VTSHSLPLPAEARLSVAVQQRALRWILLGIVALAAFLVAVVGQPPAQPIDGPGPGLVGVSHQSALSSHG